jgi:hypothetical protein
VVLLHHALKLPTLRLRQPLTQRALHVRLHDAFLRSPLSLASVQLSKNAHKLVFSLGLMYLEIGGVSPFMVGHSVVGDLMGFCFIF